jgi:F-type H+-transporting ATPase subunit b
MPQLDVSTYMGQILWLILAFGFLYLGITQVFVPRIVKCLAARGDKVNTLIAQAQDLRNKALLLQESQKKEANKLQLELDRISLQTHEFCKSHHDEQLKMLEQILMEQKKHTMTELEVWKKEFNHRIENIVVDFSQDLLNKVIKDLPQQGNKINLSSYYNRLKNE